VANVRRRLVVTVAGACLALVGSAASATAAPSVAPRNASKIASLAPTSRERGTTAVDQTRRGYVVTWRSPIPLAYVDGRPEFRTSHGVLGYPTLSRDRRTLRLEVGAVAVKASAVQVWLSAHRLDLPGTPLVAGKASGTPNRPGIPDKIVDGTVTPPSDPGQSGPHPFTGFDYEAAPLPYPGFDRDMEVVGRAVVPTDVTNAPLVVFLHGQHAPCTFGGGGGQKSGRQARGPMEDFCTDGTSPVPNYLGYRYLQRMLASQGYATISISGNVVNAEDFLTADLGAQARGTLVRHHLDLIAQWTADPANARWHGKVDMAKVVTVGHSRGGEGVDQAFIDAPANPAFTIVGQVLIAPTDFGWQTAAYLPTTVMLPTCDGDVFDLQGQRYIEAAQTLTDDDPSLRSALLVRGANHNFFNTEWTPGPDIADTGFDDALFTSKCKHSSVTRLTRPEQRATGRTFVAASVDAMLNQTPSSIDLVDSARPIALPWAGPAVAWTSAFGGNRATVRLLDGARVAGRATPCRTTRLALSFFEKAALPGCGIPIRYERQPHWSPTGQVFGLDADSVVGNRGRTRHASFVWEAAEQAGGLALDTPLDTSGADLDLRVAPDPRYPAATFAVRISDGSSTWTSDDITLHRFTGTSVDIPVWAQDVRVPLGSASINRAAITSIELVSRTDSGHVWILDASARRPGVAAVPQKRLPTVSLGDIRKTEGNAEGVGIAKIPFRINGALTAPAQFAVGMEQHTFGDRARPYFVTTTVLPGETNGTIDMPYERDRLHDFPESVQLAVAAPLTGLSTARRFGFATIVDDDPMPKVTVSLVHNPIKYGQKLRYRVELAKPIDYALFAEFVGKPNAGARQLRTSDVPKAFLAQLYGSDVRGPLWRAINEIRGIRAGGLSTVFVVPTLSRPAGALTRSLTLRVNVERIHKRITGRVTS
jgi:hypothetical protein